MALLLADLMVCVMVAEMDVHLGEWLAASLDV